MARSSTIALAAFRGMIIGVVAAFGGPIIAVPISLSEQGAPGLSDSTVHPVGGVPEITELLAL